MLLTSNSMDSMLYSNSRYLLSISDRPYMLGTFTCVNLVLDIL